MGRIKNTIWELDPHTKAKHEILRKYLDAWLPILTCWRGRVVFVDGFAGPGIYKGGEKGSPILALESLLNHKTKIEADVHFIFIEKDTKRRKHLALQLESYKLPSNVTYECLCSSFYDAVPNMLDEMDKSGVNDPTFFFIDPFGFKDIPFHIIRRIMSTRKCEVLITFMYEEINRFISLPQMQDICNNLFGCKDWQAAIEKEDPQDRLRILHQAYRKQLETVAQFVVSFKMVNKSNKTDYFLFFATNHIKGLKAMKEAMWRVNPAGEYEFSDASYDPTQTTLFEIEPNFHLLKKLILERFKGEETTIEGIETFVLTHTPFRETHI